MDLENVNGGGSDGGSCNKGQSGDGNDDNSSDPSDIDHDSIITYEVNLSSSILVTVSHNFFVVIPSKNVKAMKLIGYKTYNNFCHKKVEY